MKIIAFGDIHMATSNLSKIEELTSADLVLITGDITNFGYREDAKIILNDILAYNKNLLCLAGNLDNRDVNDYLEDLGMNLHAQAHMLHRKICIYGVGGSNKTPFQTPWEFSELELAGFVEEAHHQAMELLEIAQPLSGMKIPSVLVSHTPPYGTKVDRLTNGQHVGSKSIRKFIEKYSPDLCITGHIHESKGVDTIGSTRIINPGMLVNGGWIRITLNGNTLESTLQ